MVGILSNFTLSRNIAYLMGACTTPNNHDQEYMGGAEADTVFRMGELEPWIDENFVRTVWFNMGEQVNVKMIRDKFSG